MIGFDGQDAINRVAAFDSGAEQRATIRDGAFMLLRPEPASFVSCTSWMPMEGSSSASLPKPVRPSAEQARAM